MPICRRPTIDKIGRRLYDAHSAAPDGKDCGGVAERLKAADCKSALLGVRWFESSPLHHPAAGGVGGNQEAGSACGVSWAGVAQW